MPSVPEKELQFELIDIFRRCGINTYKQSQEFYLDSLNQQFGNNGDLVFFDDASRRVWVIVTKNIWGVYSRNMKTSMRGKKAKIRDQALRHHWFWVETVPSSYLVSACIYTNESYSKHEIECVCERAGKGNRMPVVFQPASKATDSIWNYMVHS